MSVISTTPLERQAGYVFSTRMKLDTVWVHPSWQKLIRSALRTAMGKLGLATFKCASVSLGPPLHNPSLCALLVLSALTGVIALLVLSRAAWLS